MRPRGFTLLELIVVIAIIGVLSVIILPTFSTAIDKARVAKGLNFASSLDRSLEIVGSWKFEEGSGTTVKDESGGGSTATIVSGTWSTDVYGGAQQYSMNYTSPNTSVTTAAKANHEIGTGSKSWSVWFKTSSSSVQQIIFRHSGFGNANGFFIATSNGLLNCQINLSPSVVLVSKAIVTDNVWHHGLCSLDRPNGIVKLFVDGNLVSQADASVLAGINLDSTGFTNGLGSAQYTGLLDDFRIYNSSITLSQAKQIYLEGISSGRFANR